MADDTPDTPEETPDATPPTGPRVGLREARIEPVNIEDELKQSYMDYAMSVIVGRALPDVRDGLKPVHRRILYSMDEGGLRPDKPYRKCASAVGDVMKKYHPHGDSAIYDALVRMGQDFSIRYQLIDGHGNFGSIDGDPAAAMRYTEARLSKLAMELLRDINEDTVDLVDNYDGYEQEPVVLPSRFPNLLANGATGIAVGMATNIPPHNLGELIDATIAKIDDPSLDAVDLMEYIQGPDFPTGGLILGRRGIHDAYTTGKGSVRMRAVCDIEEHGGRQRIVVTEIPYMVNKANLLTKIAELVTRKVITGISDLRDESSHEGLRVVIELKRDANGQVVLNQLYKHTQLQDTFGVNMLALVGGVPKTLTLDQCLQHYIDHQVQVIVRRTRYRLRMAEDRAHIVEGLLRALDHIDEIIALIRASADVDVARDALMEQFDFSERQARAILDMQLRRLAALERQRLEDEYDQLMARIRELREILDSPDRQFEVIKTELAEIRERFADPRRSAIVLDDGEVDVEDLIPRHDVAITLTSGGYLKRTRVDEFRAQRRGGRGVKGADMRDDDVVSTLLTCSSHDYLLFFTNEGRVYRIKAYQVPEKGRASKGVYVANVPGLTLGADERVNAVQWLSEFRDDQFLIFATKRGLVKRTELSAYDSPRSVLIAINLRDDDELLDVALTNGDADIFLVSKGGKAIRFHETEARAMGRNAAGVIGMKFKHDDDEVISLAVLDKTKAGHQYLMAVTDKGYGKRTPMAEYPIKKRGGMGVITIDMTDKNGQLVAARVVNLDDDVLLVTDGGVVIRFAVVDVSQVKRNTQGVRLMRPDQGTRVVDARRVVENDDEDEDGSPEPSGTEEGGQAVATTSSPDDVVVVIDDDVDDDATAVEDADDTDHADETDDTDDRDDDTDEGSA